MEDHLRRDSSSCEVVAEEDDEIYEKIEAPKFVDFTFPDRTRPDDKSWFCVRIGCEQNHEEVDSDALYRSFKLRVMAARSPNLKKQRTRAPEKCPNSAPVKPAKDGILRMGAFTSIPEKMAMAKLKQHQISSLRESLCKPKANVKTIATEKATEISRELRSQTKQQTFQRHKQPKAPALVPKDRNTPVFHNPGLEMCSTKKKKKQQLSVDDERMQPPTGSSAISSRKCIESSVIKKATTVGSALKNCCRPVFTEAAENLPREDTVDDENKENSLVIHEYRNMNSSSPIFVNHPPEEAKSQKKAIPEKLPFQVVKLKQKTTDPKPFRFRTDERGILKEANSERRLKTESMKGSSKVDGIKKQKETQGSSNKSLNNASQRPLPNITSSVKVRETLLGPYKERVVLIKEFKSKQRVHIEGRKVVTVPREPHFHKINIPKSCTKRQEIAVT
ncbi:hypothetical protein AXF42_Ash000074 [Apostasia shenzhenica]|uniref:Uncharacterized protein n=1 Tax=Apostasia shenzhenica TaxID=1088818 RepID=A0A2I0AFB4_9ASPA|nr:hypothetical protein AXF42_Ash000074 [Apostasia shenzhenica]